MINEDAMNRIKVRWWKWKRATRVLCDRKIPMKGKFYRTSLRPTMLYGSECWASTAQHIRKISASKMRMLR